MSNTNEKHLGDCGAPEDVTDDLNKEPDLLPLGYGPGNPTMPVKGANSIVDRSSDKRPFGVLRLGGDGAVDHVNFASASATAAR